MRFYVYIISIVKIDKDLAGTIDNTGYDFVGTKVRGTDRQGWLLRGFSSSAYHSTVTDGDCQTVCVRDLVHRRLTTRRM
jgi:hypothetical protein